MFGLSISMRFLLNLTLLLYFKVQKHNQISVKSLKLTTKCFFDDTISQNIEISWVEKMCLVWALKWLWQPLFNTKPNSDLQTSMILIGADHLISTTLVYSHMKRQSKKTLLICLPSNLVWCLLWKRVKAQQECACSTGFEKILVNENIENVKSWFQINTELVLKISVKWKHVRRRGQRSTTAWSTLYSSNRSDVLIFTKNKSSLNLYWNYQQKLLKNKYALFDNSASHCSFLYRFFFFKDKQRFLSFGMIGF